MSSYYTQTATLYASSYCYLCVLIQRVFLVSDFYGRDLPAYRPEDKTVLVNKEAKTYAASCGGRHEKTKRLCGCG